jgi:hypothetical protein
VSGPTFATVTTLTATTGHVHVTLTGNFTAATGSPYATTVRATDTGALTNDKTFDIVVTNANGAPTLNQPADLTVAENATGDRALSGSDPDGDALTFSKVSGPTFATVTTLTATTGNVHVTLTGNFSAASGSPYPTTVRASDGALTNDKTFNIVVTNVNQAPALSCDPDPLVINEGDTGSLTVTATDPDGNPVALSMLPGSPLGASFVDNGNNTGTFSWMPNFTQAGNYSVCFRGNDGNGGVTDHCCAVQVVDVNRVPVACINNGAASVTGVIGIGVSFDGACTSDPDANSLSYSWDFDASNGITTEATGVGPVSHIYPAAGTYVVTLTVTETGTVELYSDTDTIDAIISDVFAARLYTTGGNHSISLGAGKPKWCVQIEPSGGSFALANVDLSTIVMKYGSNQISADPSKTLVDGDKDGNGVPEIRACFTKTDLRVLFAGLPSGSNPVTVTIEGDVLLPGGTGKFSGTLDLIVKSNGSFLAASVSPNPLNPEATLTFALSKPGSVKVDMFDIQGRLVRSLLDESFMAAGYHDVKIDGHGRNGEKLASGIYFVRGVSVDGVFKLTITILK